MTDGCDMFCPVVASLQVGPKKLRKLVIKKLDVKEDALDALLLTSIREKVRA